MNILEQYPKVKNIIFDLGGVILRIDYNLTATAFKNLGAADFDDIYSQARQNELFDRLEKGQISAGGFADEVRRMFRSKWSDAAIFDAWNAMLIDLPPDRIALLRKLSEKFRLFLLSNTNELHLAGCKAIFRSVLGREDLSPIFVREYYSHLLGMRKPDREVFDHILHEQGLQGEETLFIDDSIQHVEGGRRAGLFAHHLEAGQSIVSVFGNVG